MHFQLSSLLAVAIASFTIANPLWQAPADSSVSHVKEARNSLSNRPVISFSPKTPHYSPFHHPKRNRICYVQSHNNGADDSQYILTAVQACNGGGHIVFNKTVKYTIGTALDLTFLKSVDIDIQGTIQFTNDTTYWQASAFRLIFQNATTFWMIGGHDVNIYGGGTLDGNGQVWYDLYAAQPLILRPILMGIVGLHGATISNLVLRYSPQYYHFITNSTRVTFDSIDISGASKSVNIAKNTDGWDTYRVKDIVIQNSVINNGDDCVSFKPNSTNILVQNLSCNGSHGISVGSLGQYKGAYDIVENVYVYNTSLHNATDGARIKVWPNTASAASVDLQGGGGDGRVNNITYEQMFIDNVDYAIEVDQCYGQNNITLCNMFPSPLTITNVVFKNFTGVTSKKYQPQIGAFACSSLTACSNIAATSINVKSPNGTKQAYCQNLNNKVLDVTCVTTLLGFN